MTEREQGLVNLVEHLIEELYSAWHEGAADCHTTGEDEHYPETDAHDEEQKAKALLAKIMEGSQ